MLPLKLKIHVYCKCIQLCERKDIRILCSSSHALYFQYVTEVFLKRHLCIEYNGSIYMYSVLVAPFFFYKSSYVFCESLLKTII